MSINIVYDLNSSDEYSFINAYSSVFNNSIKTI